MDKQQAEEFFKKYRGDAFLMDREDPVGANEYRAAKIDATQEGIWRTELCDELIGKMMDDTAYAWMYHMNCIEVLKEMKARRKDYCAKLMDVTNWLVQCESLDARQRIIMLENMAGRTDSFSDGGICLMAKHIELKSIVSGNVVGLASFTPTAADNQDLPGWENVRTRYDKAVENCRKAFKKFYR